MKQYAILFKVYSASVLTVGAILLSICVLLGYDLLLTLHVLSASIVISAPPVLALNTILWILAKVRLGSAASWMLVLASLPLMSLLPASLLVRALPGDQLVLMVICVLSGYAGIFSQAISITKLFNGLNYESK
jgi:hypothetical protein